MKHAKRDSPIRRDDATEVPPTQPGPATVRGDSAAGSLVGSVIGGCQLLSLLGSGSMGRVYKAEQRLGSGTRFVAVKTILPGLAEDDAHVRYFQREAEIAGSLKTPYVIKVLNDGFDPVRQVHYLVMEYADGGTILEYARRTANDHRLPPAEAARFLLQAALGLSEAEQHAGIGIVHRDIKPSNLLLTTSSEDPDQKDIRIADFGCAKRMNVDLSQQTGFVGTMRYASPEHLGGEVDSRSDMYSLGATFYHVLTGRAAAPDTQERVHEFFAATPYLDPGKDTGCEPLRRVIMRTTARQKEDRYRTFAELAHDLERICAGQRVRIPKPPSGKGRWLWAAGIAGGVIAGGVFALSRLPPRPTDVRPTLRELANQYSKQEAYVGCVVGEALLQSPAEIAPALEQVWQARQAVATAASSVRALAALRPDDRAGVPVEVASLDALRNQVQEAWDIFDEAKRYREVLSTIDRHIPERAAAVVRQHLEDARDAHRRARNHCSDLESLHARVERATDEASQARNAELRGLRQNFVAGDLSADLGYKEIDAFMLRMTALGETELAQQARELSQAGQKAQSIRLPSWPGPLLSALDALEALPRAIEAAASALSDHDGLEDVEAWCRIRVRSQGRPWFEASLRFFDTLAKELEAARQNPGSTGSSELKNRARRVLRAVRASVGNVDSLFTGQQMVGITTRSDELLELVRLLEEAMRPPESPPPTPAPEIDPTRFPEGTSPTARALWPLGYLFPRGLREHAIEDGIVVWRFEVRPVDMVLVKVEGTHPFLADVHEVTTGELLERLQDPQLDFGGCRSRTIWLDPDVPDALWWGTSYRAASEFVRSAYRGLELQLPTASHWSVLAGDRRADPEATESLVTPPKARSGPRNSLGLYGIGGGLAEWIDREGEPSLVDRTAYRMPTVSDWGLGKLRSKFVDGAGFRCVWPLTPIPR